MTASNTSILLVLDLIDEILEAMHIKQRVGILPEIYQILEWGNYPHSNDLWYDMIRFLKGDDSAFYVTDDCKLQELLKGIKGIKTI